MLVSCAIVPVVLAPIFLGVIVVSVISVDMAADAPVISIIKELRCFIGFFAIVFVYLLFFFLYDTIIDVTVVFIVDFFYKNEFSYLSPCSSTRIGALSLLASLMRIPGFHSKMGPLGL
jgi:hypothetical protein